MGAGQRLPIPPKRREHPGLTLVVSGLFQMPIGFNCPYGSYWESLCFQRSFPKLPNFSPLHPGLKTRTQRVQIPGDEDLVIRSLRDHQQFYDPNGAAARLGICSASWPLFGLVWPSSVYLAQRLSQRAVIPNERILEIGCGLALPTLVGRRRGATITASDRHPMTRPFLEANAQLNEISPIKYRHGQWGTDVEACVSDTGAELLSARYDLILGSDLLYDRDAPAEVAYFIDDHAQPGAEVWIVDPDRGHRPAFTREMARYGFELVNQERIEAPASETAERPYKGRLLQFVRKPGVNPS